MYKIIDLGNSVPETGEPRARIVDAGMVKTASTEIQNFWDKLQRNDEKAYLWVIGVSAMEYYGCNNNGDAFHEADLKATYQDFVRNAHIFIHHVNRDPRKSIGKPIYAWYNNPMHRVELILEIDRNAQGAEDVVRRISDGEQMYVSMGCTVKYDICSICGNKAPTRALYCDHLRYNMKKILPDGRQVYAINPNPKFFDISIVTRPADPTAFALDKLAEEGMYNYEPLYTSAELGEQEELRQEKLAAVDKLADILKKVDAKVIDKKEPLHDLAENHFEDFDYPEMDYPALERMHISPMGLFALLEALKAPMSLGDAFWMSGAHRFFPRHEAFSALPDILGMLVNRPSLFDMALHSFMHSYHDELDNPARKIIAIKIIRPVTVRRMELIKDLFPLEKTSAFVGRDSGISNNQVAMFGVEPKETSHYGRNPIQAAWNSVDSSKQNFKQLEFVDEYGHRIKTTPYDIRNGSISGLNFGGLGTQFGGTALGALMAMGAIGVLLSSKPSLLTKLIASSALAVPAIHMLTEKKYKSTNTGEEIPVSTLMNSWKREVKPIVKTSEELRLGTKLGLAVPAWLALDYAYNKWKRGGRDPVDDSDSYLSNITSRAGRYTYEHPFKSFLIGGAIGALLHRKH